MRAFMSPEPVAKYEPAGLGATEMTEFLWPCSMSCVWPVLGFQNCTPLSFEPDSTHWLSGVSATDSTKSLWPSKVLTHRPPLDVALPEMGIPRGVLSSHILIVLSRLPLTRSLPLGEKATEYTLSLWPSWPSSLSRR